MGGVYFCFQRRFVWLPRNTLCDTDVVLCSKRFLKQEKETSWCTVTSLYSSAVWLHFHVAVLCITVLCILSIFAAAQIRIAMSVYTKVLVMNVSSYSRWFNHCYSIRNQQRFTPHTDCQSEDGELSLWTRWLKCLSHMWSYNIQNLLRSTSYHIVLNDNYRNFVTLDVIHFFDILFWKNISNPLLWVIRVHCISVEFIVFTSAAPIEEPLYLCK